MFDEEKKEEQNALQEVVQKVAINPEDCTGAADFWKQFKVEITPGLQAAFERFQAEPTFENQQQVKLEVCRAIGYTEHTAFRDEMFTEIVPECQSITYDLAFDKSLEDTLDKEESKQS